MSNQITQGQQGAIITITLGRRHAVALAMAVQDRTLAGSAPQEVVEVLELVTGSPEWQKGGPVGPIDMVEINEYRLENNLPVVPPI